jgi:exodeoxyribonuclease-3
VRDGRPVIVPGVRVATWNVNSLKARLPRVEEWLQYAAPDVCCLQETKCSDEAFPAMSFQALGYDSVHYGQGQWNGVAILSRVGIESVSTGFGDLPDPYDGDARLLAATCGGVRVVTVYVPNGREVSSEHYARKLEWLGQLRTWLERNASPDDDLVLLGDFNVAPEDRDVWSAAAFEGCTHVTEPERAAIRRLCEWGLVDALRTRYDDDRLFTYWDYRRGDFHQHRGMRIDLVLVTRSLAERVTFALIDRNARKGQQPSDHAPVLVDFADPS